MSWQLGATMRATRGNMAEQELRAGAVATAAEIRATTTRGKTAGRKTLRAAGLGGIANLVRSEVTPPRGPAFDAHGTVYAKIVKRRGGGFIDLVEVFEEGTIVRARGGHFLAIADPDVVGRRGRSRMTPLDFPEGALRLVLARDRQSGVLKLRDGRVAFGLTKQVTLPAKARGLSDAVARAGDGLEERIARRWDRVAAQAGT